MKSTTTYLHFNGNCRTAMAFYGECFGGELEVMAYPDASGKPNTDPKAPVQHSMIAQGGQALLMASDYPPGSGTSSQPRREGSICKLLILLILVAGSPVWTTFDPGSSVRQREHSNLMSKCLLPSPPDQPSCVGREMSLTP
jgi:hypothetical protein